MEVSQTKALAALQPFIELVTSTKSPTPRFLSDIITRATSAHGTYVFTELLQLEPIQSLRTSDNFGGYLTLLELFSWGTWEEYHASKNLPMLSDAQSLKLRQLTILSLCASPSFPLTYENLIQALSLSGPSELESVITSSIYAGLITARLSPTTNPSMVHVTSTAPLRDLRPMRLEQLLKVLQTWERRCDTVIQDMESQIEMIKTDARKRKLKEGARDHTLEKALRDHKASGPQDISAMTLKDVPGMGVMDVRPNRGQVASGKGAGRVAVRGGSAGRLRGGNKRDLEEAEDEEEDAFEDAQEAASTGGVAMELDESTTTGNSPLTPGGRVAKRRGG